MLMYPKAIQKLIDFFSDFPTVGPRTATRFVFYLLKIPQEKLEEISKAILDLKKEMKICEICFNPFQGEENLCPICQDPHREHSKICVVQNETDLIKIESTKKYNGVYHILGGTLKLGEKNPEKKLKIQELLKRVEIESNQEKEVEVILALNPTLKGEATSKYLENQLKSLNIKITRLGRGLPIGAELEYADEETLSSALEERR